MRKSISFLAVAFATAAITPATAWGHASVIGRTPAPSSTVHAVRSVGIKCNEGVVTGKLTVTKGGKLVGKGLLVNHNKEINANFSKSLPRGVYTVSWRCLSDDGHRESGSWAFTVR